jgi:glycolate oxidase FAD binding subunit
MSETRTQLQQSWNEISAIVGPGHIQQAAADDMVDGVQPQAVISPATPQEVAQVLHFCESSGLAVVPRGGGTKLSLGNRPQKADFILSTARLNRVVEHAWDDMSVTVQAGCTIADLQRVLKQHGQRLAADPIQPEKATVGGVLATAESGTLRIRFGAMRDLVLGMEVALPDGGLIRAGGKVVKNVAGYDLCKLAIGSLGTLGIITGATFRLHPLPAAARTYTKTLRAATLRAGLTELVLAIRDSNLSYTALQIRAGSPEQVAVDVCCEGIADSLEYEYGKLRRLANAQDFAECAAEVWSEREKLFVNAAGSAICKCAVQPNQLGELCEAVFRQAGSCGAVASVVAQGTGLAEVRLDAADIQAQRSVLSGLRTELERLEGTLTVLQCFTALKRELDVWGPMNEALPLMKRIKERFDPVRVLNPGRFVGGI